MRYFFHSRDGVVVTDVEGDEFVDDAAAKREAAVLFAELLRDRPDAFWTDHHLEVTVTDATGRQVAVVRAVAE